MHEILKKWLYDPIVGKLIAVIITVIVVLLLVRLLRNSLNRYIKDINTRYRVRKIVSIIGYIVTAIIIATIFSDRLGSLTVVFGVAGAGIAFALQEVIASIAGWAAISAGGFYSPGDRIQLGGIKGDVIDISILRTTLMEIGEWVAGDLYTGRIVKVANSFVFKEPVFNYSGDFPFLWDEITLPVKYGSDWMLARQMLRRIVDEVLVSYAEQVKESWLTMVRKYRIEEANVEPMITLRATDNWIEFVVRYVVDYRKRRWMKDHLFTRILEEIDKSNNQIRLASATFEIVPGSTVDVSLSSDRHRGD
ncbi:MAG TPA: mechanosensitive ion channel [Spirochaetota bacterium]|nr:mechanosensitive ion channel [Spirochaetota bacterium]HRT77546.1 mechanosensitive ion channel [Spirochaetota bacterium]